MIAYLNGKIAFKSPAFIYVDCNGVGYHVNISLHTYAQIEQVDQVKIFTYLHVKEDSHTLYGFGTTAERDVFIHLISVSGIGPNTGRVILSYMSPEEVQSAILHENVVALNKVKGVGPKTAKRIILDLKDKVAKTIGDISGITPIVNNTLKDEALSALVALGFPKNSIQKTIDKVVKGDPEVNSVESLIKKVLKQLS